MTFKDRVPFSDIVAKHKRITSAAVDTLITRAPWQPGAQKYYTIRKAIVTPSTNSGFANGCTVTLWDKDLSSTTPSARGDASNGAIVTIVPVSNASGAANVATTFLISETQMPPHRFEAGITAQSSTLNTHIQLELELH